MCQRPSLMFSKPLIATQNCKTWSRTPKPSTTCLPHASVRVPSTKTPTAGLKSSSHLTTMLYAHNGSTGRHPCQEEEARFYQIANEPICTVEGVTQQGISNTRKQKKEDGETIGRHKPIPGNEKLPEGQLGERVSEGRFGRVRKEKTLEEDRGEADM
eukprot:c54946_g1_i1 orf=121-591(+)